MNVERLTTPKEKVLNKSWREYVKPATVKETGWWMHHRKTKAETSKGKVCYTTQQWLTKKAEQHIRDVVRERLAPPAARVQSLESHI